jgi:hypothetical protein
MSDHYVAKAAELSMNSTNDLLEKIQLTGTATHIDPQNKNAAQLFERAASAWIDRAVGESGNAIRQANGTSSRVSLETLNPTFPFPLYLRIFGCSSASIFMRVRTR